MVAKTHARSHRTQSVTVVIPTYNEAETICTVIDQCRTALSKAGYRPQILVVDDDSPDGTASLIETTYSETDAVRVHVRTGERGRAAAIAEGFRLATGEFCTVIDADGQHDPACLVNLVDAMTGDTDEVDVAIGSRYVDGGEIDGWSQFRRTVSKSASIGTKIGLPRTRPIADPMSGLFAVRSSILDGATLAPSGYKALLEVLVTCDVDPDRIVEVPYTFTEREAGESTLGVGEYQSFLEHVGALILRARTDWSPAAANRWVRLTEFLSIGAVGVLVNMAAFAVVVGAGLHYLLAGGVGFVLALQWNFVGNWAVTFNRPRDHLLQRYGVFQGVSVIGFGIHELVLVALVGIVGLPAIGANALAILVASGWNFYGSDSAAFAEPFVPVRSLIGYLRGGADGQTPAFEAEGDD